MTDIASLGFSVDTQPLTRVNGELTAMIRNAGQADRAVNSLAGNISRMGRAGAANTNAAAVAFQRMAAGATNAASQVAAANRTIGTAANASAAAIAAGTRASAQAAAAQNAAAAAATRAGHAHAGFAANLNASANATTRANSIFNTFNSTVNGSVGGMNRLIGMAVALAAALTASEFAKASDHFTNLQNAMKLAGVEGSDLIDVQTRLFEAANKNGVPVEALTTLYRRGSIAAKELGKSQNDLLEVVNVVAASLRVQGSSVEAARGALLQLSQSFGTGVVHAEEYNSLLENAYPLLLAAAKGMEGMGGSVAKLTNAVKSGQVSSKAFFDAIQKGGKDVVAMAGSIDLTFGGAWQSVVNGFTLFVGEAGKTTGATSAITGAMVGLGKALDDLANDKQFLSDLKGVFDQIAAAVSQAVGAMGSLIGMLKDGLAWARQMGREANSASALKGGEISVDSKGNFVQMRGLREYNAELNKLDSYIARESAKYENDYKTVKGPNRKDYLTDEYNRIQGLRAQYKELYEERTQLLNTATSRMIGDPDDGTAKPSSRSDFGIVTPSKLDDKGKATDITKVNKGAENSYRKLIQSAKDYIELENDKTTALGMSIEQGRVFTHEQEMLNKAAMANIPITDALKGRIRELAVEMAKVDAAYSSAKFMKDFKQNNEQLVQGYQLESATLTMSTEAAMAYRIEQEALLKARQQGINLGPAEIQQIRDTAAATAAAAKQAEDYKFVMDTLRDAGKGAIEGILSALIRGTSVWDAFANAANRALDRIISKIADVAIDGIFDFANGSSSSGSSSSGGGIGSVFKSFLGSGSGSGGLSGILDNFSDKLSSMWSQTSSWLGMGDSMYSAGQAGSAFFGPTAAASGVLGSGISGMSMLGAGMSAFGGISSLLKGGTANTIGGIGQLLGAGVSLIPGIGQIAGPIISILSSVLPGLIGEEDKRTHTYSNGNLVYGADGYYTNGSAQGEGASSSGLEKALSGAGADIQKIYDLLGGVKDASKVWGLNLNSWTASGKDWSYTSNATSLIAPNGNQEAWRMNMGNMMDTGSAQVALRSILGGALGDITDSMKTALTTLVQKGINAEATLEKVAEAITFVKDVYDELGKPVLSTKNALKELQSQFDAVKTQATELGLSLDPVTAALDKARKDVAESYLHGINQYFDPIGVGLSDLAKAADQARLEIQYLIDQGLASAADLNKVENYYAEQETKLKEQLYGATLESLREVIESLKSGSLSGATSKTQYNAAYQSFFDDITASLNGDTEASARVRDEAINLATMGQSQFGAASSQYQDLKSEIAQALALLEEKIGSTSGGNSANGTQTNGYSNEYVQSLVMQLASSQNTIASQTQQINTLLSKMADLMDTMQRIASNQ